MPFPPQYSDVGYQVPSPVTFTPTYTGFSVNPGDMTYILIGKLCLLTVTCSGTSNAGTFTFSVPTEIIPATTITGSVRGISGGVEQTAASMLYNGGATSIWNVYRSYQIGGSGWSGSSEKAIMGQIAYLVQG